MVSDIYVNPLEVENIMWVNSDNGVDIVWEWLGVELGQQVYSNKYRPGFYSFKIVKKCAQICI